MFPLQFGLKIDCGQHELMIHVLQMNTAIVVFEV